MNVSKLYSVYAESHKLEIVTVEVAVRKGLPRFQIVGLASTYVKESAERIRSAIESTGREFPLGSILVNLSPSDSKKSHASLDLAIAIGILCAESANLEFPFPLENTVILGELGLDGTVKSNKQIETFLQFADVQKFKSLVPVLSPKASNRRNTKNAYRIQNLKDIFEKKYIQNSEHLSTENQNKKTKTIRLFENQVPIFKSLAIAISGNHHVLMIGSPGVGKSFLMKTMEEILPKISEQHFRERVEFNLANTEQIPIRTPHHSSSLISILGGGLHVQPGEVTLAHGGILFFDELSFYKPEILHGLREPLETKKISISRNLEKIDLPSEFLFIGASNPCSCGNFGNILQECTCLPPMVKQYLGKFTGPTLDRFHIGFYFQPSSSNKQVEIDLEEYRNKIQRTRIQKLESKETLRWTWKSRNLYDLYTEHSRDSSRSILQVKSLTETVAIFKGRDYVTVSDLNEALGMRQYLNFLKKQFPK